MNKKCCHEEDAFEVEWFKEKFNEQHELLKLILKEIKIMAVDQATFDTDLTTLTTDVATLADLVTQLIAKIGTGTTPLDLTSEDTSVNTSDATVQASIAASKTALGL